MATLLLIEDDPVILRLLQVSFEVEGFDVVVATDGEAGIALARELRPDLVISDIMMPKRSGLELVTAVRADPATADVPVVLLSAKAQAADVQAGLEAGADDYVTKPFAPLDLLERVTALLAARRSER
jgi:DNA-binding response OmpR family regulator